MRALVEQGRLGGNGSKLRPGGSTAQQLTHQGLRQEAQTNEESSAGSREDGGGGAARGRGGHDTRKHSRHPFSNTSRRRTGITLTVRQDGQAHVKPHRSNVTERDGRTHPQDLSQTEGSSGQHETTHWVGRCDQTLPLMARRVLHVTGDARTGGALALPPATPGRALEPRGG